MTPNNLPSPNVNPLWSNANYFPFFKLQILDHASLKKWDDNFTLLFITDHFTRPAAKYIIQVK